MADFSDIVSRIESCPDASSVHELVSEVLGTYETLINSIRSEDVEVTSEKRDLLSNEFFQLIQQTLRAISDILYKESQVYCYAEQLVETFKMCIRYGDVICVGGYRDFIPPYRAWLIWYYIVWKKFDEAKREWSDVIGDFVSDGGYVVKPGELNCDEQTTPRIIKLVLEVTGSIVDNQIDDEEAFSLLFTMVDNIRTWFRMISDDKHLHRKLVTVLCRCTGVLVEKINTFDEDLLRDICVLTFLEYTNLSNDEMLEEYGCMLCASVLSMTKIKHHFACNVMASIAKNGVVKHQELQYTKTVDGVPSLRSQMETLKVQVQALDNLKLLKPKISLYIQNNISNILLDVIYKQEESRDLVIQARQAREHGVEGLEFCIYYLDQAINKLEDLWNKDNENSGGVAYELAEAYCLRALCKQEKNPNSEFVEDLKKAIDVWSGQNLSKFVETTHLVSQKTCNLLYRAVDLLLLRVMEDGHSPSIYEMLIKCWIWRKDTLTECLASLWLSRSLGHTLCTSPLHDGLITAISKNCDDPDSINIWRSCMDKSKLLKVDYHQRFSVTPTLSIQPNTHDDNNNQQTINQMKQDALDLIQNVPMSTKAEFLAAHIYYDLCERTFSNGSVLEALVYAKDACRLRFNLFERFFIYSLDENSSLLSMRPSVATEAWSSEFKDFILTPYNVLRCYLESTLQVGTIEEIVGNGKTAEQILLVGKQLSSLQGLSFYTIRFALVLGKIYRKKKLWHLAKKELESLEHSWCRISCSKCRVIMEVTVEQERGDYLRSSFNHKERNDLEMAISCFRDAVNKLKCLEWENNVSRPVKESKTMLCDALFTAGKEVTDSISDLDEIHCWHCLPVGITKSKSLKNVTRMKWEFTRRRYLLRLLTGLGKCLVVLGNNHKAHEVFLESISLLVSRSTFHPRHPSISFSFLNMLVENNIVGDFVVMEHVSLLYIISWFSLQSCYEDGKRKQSCDELLTSIVPCLKLAFVLCSEVPGLLKKVSRLLSIMYTLSFENTEFAIKSSSSNTLSKSQWASYFHKATLGTPLNFWLPSLFKQENSEHTMFVSPQSSSSYICSHRLAPRSVVELEDFVRKFFQKLPKATILGISIFKDGYGRLLQKLLPNSSFTGAWIMFSRVSSECAPVVIVLPVDSILQGDIDGDPGIFKRVGQEWRPPWGITIVDEIAPTFRKFLKERTFCSINDMERTDTLTSLYLDRLSILNDWIGKFLRNMEQLWFGPWKYLLLGGLLEDYEHIEYETIGCYIGERQSGSRLDRLHELLSQIGEEGSKAVSEKRKKDREPVILVPDFDIQMLPWESMPVLWNQEVYRMPCVASIMYLYDKCRTIQKKDGNDSTVFPMIDPLDAFYVVNPSKELISLEDIMEDWFEPQGLQGICRDEPSEAELARELVNRDLFIYLGHGNGLQYISGNEIAKLERCAATILMGCCSGELTLNGSYIPEGAPLYYLFAGSPIVVANLWTVASAPMCDFCYSLLEALRMARVDSETSTFYSRRIGSVMGEARDYLGHENRFLMGGATVCFGIPTGIRKRKR